MPAPFLVDCTTSMLGTGLRHEETGHQLDQVATGLAYGRSSGAASCYSCSCRAWRDAARTPRCTVVVDTREQNPLDFSRFEGWFAGIETRALKLGDYSIAGLEDRCVVERKDLPDLTQSFTAERPMFVHRLRLMSQYPHRLLVITAALTQIKSPQPYGGGSSNQMTQSLIAALAGLQFRSYVRRLMNWEKRWSRRTLPGSPLSLAGS